MTFTNFTFMNSRFRTYSKWCFLSSKTTLFLEIFSKYSERTTRLLHLIIKGGMEMDEIELAKQAINGNEVAQLQLLNLYKESMYRVAYSYMQNEHDANDALQEMTYQCLKNIHKVHSPQYFKTWLVRIVINTCLMMKRQHKRIVVTNDLLEQPQHMAELFELNNVISQLPIEQQELIHLKYFKDLKNSEIATLQNIPEGTVKSRLHKTLKKLRHLLGEGGVS